MRLTWHSLVVWLVCGVLAPWQMGRAAAPPVGQPFEVVLESPKPPTPTDPVDIAARVDLGDDAIWWGFVGTFELREAGREKLVALYYSDSDQNGLGSIIIPSFFALHAVTKDREGRWIGRKIYSCTRCSFGRVLERTASSVALLLQPHWLMWHHSDMSPVERDRWQKIAEEANTPFTLTLSLSAGRPVISFPAHHER